LIRVADEGAGLSPEDLGRLFGRFQRLSAKPTAGESSTGLGLSIVKRIIDMHGGEVTAESAGPNKRSTFTIGLPATELSSARANRSSSSMTRRRRARWPAPISRCTVLP